jgi:ABC-type multidrug transport system ATPase subunit
VLIVDEPTRGIDIATKAEVHHLLLQLARDGVGILMISSELPEVLLVSDRVLVMREGRLAAEFTRVEATEERIIAAATGQAAVQPGDQSAPPPREQTAAEPANQPTAPPSGETAAYPANQTAAQMTDQTAADSAAAGQSAAGRGSAADQSSAADQGSADQGSAGQGSAGQTTPQRRVP